ncbi:MAG: putative sulfate exporter family transporter [Lacisediminihabitans sp.]
MRWLPGVVVAGAATGAAFALHGLFPVLPLLTASVGLGILAGQLPPVRRWIDGILKNGLTFSAKKLMRVGIVLLGLKLSLVDIVHLGWVAIVLTVLIVLLTFAITWGLGKLFRLPGDEPVLLATGFSICGASAIGAMSAVTRTKHEDQATPVALVTLFGTLAIGVLPLLQGPLGLNAHQFGQWVGASVHDVGQVVATAQTAGAAALAIAVVVKLTRVLMLAPMVATASVVVRRTRGPVEGEKLPPIVPLFVAGFIAMVLVRTFVSVPIPVLDVADFVQTIMLSMALFGLGSAIRLEKLLSSGLRAIMVGIVSWAAIAGMALVAVHLS